MWLKSRKLCHQMLLQWLSLIVNNKHFFLLLNRAFALWGLLVHIDICKISLYFRLFQKDSCCQLRICNLGNIGIIKGCLKAKGHLIFEGGVCTTNIPLQLYHWLKLQLKPFFHKCKKILSLPRNMSLLC